MDLDVSAPSWPIHRLSAHQVLRMVECGVLAEDERLELLDGVLTPMSPPGPEHALVVGRIADLLRRAAPDGWHVREEKPLMCGPDSLPQPDVALVLGSHEEYATRHPFGHESALVIEVARSSQERDREKARVYAAGGVATYVIVDLVAREVHVHRESGPDGYLCEESPAGDEPIELVEPGMGVRVAEIFTGGRAR